MEATDDIFFSAYKIFTSVAPLFLFCWKLKHRRYFALRIIAVVALCVGLEYLSKAISFRGVFFLLHSLYNISIFAVLCLAMWLCFKENFFVVLYCCIAGKCTMHIGEYANALAVLGIGFPYTYVSLAVSLTVYIAIYLLFARKIKTDDCSMLNNKQIIAYAFVVICVTDMLIMDFSERGASSAIQIVVYSMIIILCFTVLFLQFMSLNESKIRRRTEVLEQLRIKEREQFEISSETIKLIGIKHHDIKNMLELHRGKFSDEEIDKLNQSIEAHNIAFNTGNKTLDVILTEESIVCANLGIRMECIVNGEPLAFMDDMDIYSLYLNAIKNAVESVRKIEDTANRTITVRTYKRDSLLFIKVQNYCAEEPVIRHGNAIATTKADKLNHGYGLQSIRMIAEKYGGSISIKVKNKVFNLGIAIPIS